MADLLRRQFSLSLKTRVFLICRSLYCLASSASYTQKHVFCFFYALFKASSLISSSPLLHILNRIYSFFSSKSPISISEIQTRYFSSMDQVVLVCGSWIFEKNRWLFVADPKKGCKILAVNDTTRFDDVLRIIHEDYKMDKKRYEVLLSYMIPKKRMVKLPRDTPPVFVGNSRQFHEFILQWKADPIRLCVEFNEKEVSQRSEDDDFLVVEDRENVKETIFSTMKTMTKMRECFGVNNFDIFNNFDGKIKMRNPMKSCQRLTSF